MQTEDCLIVEQCRKCGKSFNLFYDLQKIRNVKSKEPIRETLMEKCGVRDLLCWKCRVEDDI